MNHDYIQNQLKNFDPRFTKCVVKCFDLIVQFQESDGCLSNSVALYICAKEYGYDPVLCYGLCEFDGKEFYHAWLEINDTVIDVSIYGNINFSPYSLWNTKLNTPYIGNYKDSFVKYGRSVFDEDWECSMISKIEGWSFEQYMDALPDNAMWQIACKFLNRTPTLNLIKHLRTHIKNKKIERIE